MEYRGLGPNNLVVSSIGLGCATFGREIDRRTSFQVLDRALARGITLYDTAAGYSQGGSEEILGAWLADRGVRDRVMVATKVGGVFTRERVLSSAEESLRRIGVDTLDLFQLHHWDGETPLEETLTALDELVRQGKARFLGCSNFVGCQLRKALWRQDALGLARFESVQSEYNLVNRDIEGETLLLCADQSVGVMTYSPLGAGFLTGKYRRGGGVPKGTRFDVSPGHQGLYFTERGWRVLDQLRRLAEQSGISMTRVALCWVLSRSGVTSVLIGARCQEHVDQAFEAEAFKVPPELAARLSEF